MEQDDDVKSVVTTNSELSPNVPFTQEQIDAVRGFVQVTKELEQIRKNSRKLQTQLKSHKEVLIDLLRTRKKTKLALDGGLKVQLQSSSIQKKPQGPKLLDLIQSAIKDEGGDTYARLLPKIEKSLKESEETVEKHKLILEDPSKKRKKDP